MTYPLTGLFIDGRWIHDRPRCRQLGNSDDESILGAVPGARHKPTEPFGPLGPCVQVASLNEGIELANALSVGLSTSAFANSLHDAEPISREPECGVPTLNSVATLGGDAPFGGVEESGIEREGGAESPDAYLVNKTVLQSTARI